MTARPRFGVWANVHGTMAALGHPDDPVDASWKRVRDQVLLAERLGFDTTLIAQHTMNPLGEHLDQLDAWSAAAALAALTERIEIIAAIKPSIIHPTILAKQAQGIEEISGGRFAVNVVNAWWIPDLERSGIGMLEHGERYVYGTEWLHVLRRLLAGERTTFDGKYFHIDEFELHPVGTHRPRPRIYLGGESEQARDLAARRGRCAVPQRSVGRGGPGADRGCASPSTCRAGPAAIRDGGVRGDRADRSARPPNRCSTTGNCSAPIRAGPTTSPPRSAATPIRRRRCGSGSVRFRMSAPTAVPPPDSSATTTPSRGASSTGTATGSRHSCWRSSLLRRRWSVSRPRSHRGCDRLLQNAEVAS